MPRDASNHRARLMLLAATLILAPCAIRPARAADQDTAALRQQIHQLEQRVRQLELRVRELEQARAAASAAQTSTPPAAAAPTAQTSTPPGVAGPASATPPPALAAREQWQSLQRNMREEDVRRLLGGPTRILRIDNKTVWYYYYPGVGGGSVMLTDDGRVSSWQHPPFTWW